MAKVASPAPPDDGDSERGKRHREHMAKVSREQSKSARDIGPIPDVVNLARKESCLDNFKLFCLTYFPQTFSLAFSPDHDKVIAKIELAVLEGGLFALAMPRGSGKTTLCEMACLWSLLYGHRDYVVLVASDAGSAIKMLSSIKAELEDNETLADDFPEVCFPIRELSGIAQRCKGQICVGEHTQITWSADAIVLPTIPGSAASGAVVNVAGITGRIRGLKHKKPSGKSIRPSLVIVDDPQSDESAASVSQCATRERVIAGAVLGLAGPGKKISGVMPCTVIREGDMADRILDTEIHPEWNGSRFQLLYAFPTDMTLWDKYKELLNGYDPAVPGDRERAAKDATAYYGANRAAMDAGAVVAWEARHTPDELSAIQHAMNLFFRDARAFWAEFQNRPLPEDLGDVVELKPEDIAGKLNRVAKKTVPLGAVKLTAFIDVQQTLLYYVVCAWEEDFTGYVIDYGCWPEQRKAYFSLGDVQNTIARATGIEGLEGQLYKALESLVEKLVGMPWRGKDDTDMFVERCMIDANWGQSTDVVYQFCRQSKHTAVLMPSHGKFVSASSKPLTDRKKQPGERLGLNWVIPLKGKRAIKYVYFDTNFWKSFLAARLGVAMGSPGCLSLFGTSADTHRLFADHLTSEYRVRVQSKERVVEEWKLKPTRENHWLDCCVGAAVAASIQGVSLEGLPKEKVKRERKKVSWADAYNKATAGV